MTKRLSRQAADIQGWSSASWSLVPADKPRRLEAQFIFWFLMRGGGQGGSRPSYATCSPSAEVGAGPGRDRRSNILGTSEPVAHAVATLRYAASIAVEKMGSRPCPPFNPSSCPTGWRDVMETAAAAAARSIWKQQLSLSGRRSCHRRPAAAFRRPWQGHGRPRGWDAPNY